MTNDLRERLLELADNVPMIATEYEHAKWRRLALAAARMALDDAARECEDRDCGIRECCGAERAKAVEQCVSTVRAIAASLGDKGMR